MQQNAQSLTPWLAKLSAINIINPIDQLTVIDIGYSQTCFKVKANGDYYFAKYCDEASEAHERERTTAECANNAGIAPKILYADQHWLISEFINGKNLLHSPFNLQQKSLCALNLMGRFHRLSASVEALDIEQAVHALLTESTFSLDQKAELYFIAATLKAQIMVHADFLCHGDVSFANIMFDKQAWLVDFECSCLADAEYDLAMYIAINNLSLTQLPFFIQMYQNKAVEKVTIDSQKVKRYLAFCYLINGLWFLCKSNASKEQVIKQQAAVQLKHFDALQLSRFQTLSLMR